MGEGTVQRANKYHWQHNRNIPIKARVNWGENEGSLASTPAGAKNCMSVYKLYTSACSAYCLIWVQILSMINVLLIEEFLGHKN